MYSDPAHGSYFDKLFPHAIDCFEYIVHPFNRTGMSRQRAPSYTLNNYDQSYIEVLKNRGTTF